MSETVSIEGVVKGFEAMGAKFIKSDSINVFFEIKKGSDIDDIDKLKTIKNIFFGNFGLGLKIKRL